MGNHEKQTESHTENVNGLDVLCTVACPLLRLFGGILWSHKKKTARGPRSIPYSLERRRKLLQKFSSIDLFFPYELLNQREPESILHCLVWNRQNRMAKLGFFWSGDKIALSAIWREKQSTFNGCVLRISFLWLINLQPMSIFITVKCEATHRPYETCYCIVRDSTILHLWAHQIDRSAVRRTCGDE